jgi:hypothetical protein
MHTLTFKRPGTGEQVKLFRVPTETAISLVANGVAQFTDQQTQRQVENMIESLSTGKRNAIAKASRASI